MPYTVLNGGYWSLISMILAGCICGYTGKILIRCLYEEDEYGNRVRVRQSYGEIAELVFHGRLGRWTVNIAILTELIMTCISYLILCGDLLMGCFSFVSLSLPNWILISTLLVVPVVFLETMSQVSWLSLLNALSTLIMTCTVLIYCFCQASQWQPDFVKFQINIWTFPISLGIIIFSFTSQIYLSMVEGNLENPRNFNKIMWWSHAASVLAKVTFSYFGCITFGSATNEVITNNIPFASLKFIINIVFLVKAISCFPLPFYAACSLAKEVFGESFIYGFFNSSKLRSVSKIFAKFALVMFIMVMALSLPHFAILLGLIGSFTGTMLSLAWPSYFYIRIYRLKINIASLLFNWIIIGSATVFAIVGIIYSSIALHDSIVNDRLKNLTTSHTVLPLLISSVGYRNSSIFSA